MVILRPTRKLRKWLPLAETAATASDTALGDWYVNRIVVDRQPLLLLVSSTSLLSVLAPARHVRGLPQILTGLVDARLRRCGVAQATIDAERRAMSNVVIAATVDRSVLGIAVDFARAVPYHLEPGHWDETSLRLVEDRLAENPCYAGRRVDQVVFPGQRATELLNAKWGLANMRLHPTGAGVS
jgi:hypothetical protein